MFREPTPKRELGRGNELKATDWLEGEGGQAQKRPDPGRETLERLSHALNVPIRDFFEDIKSTRRVHKARLELEGRIRELTESLSDEGTIMAVEIIEVLAKHRR